MNNAKGEKAKQEFEKQRALDQKKQRASQIAHEKEVKAKAAELDKMAHKTA